jgi:hypothetical protein
VRREILQGGASHPEENRMRARPKALQDRG